MRYWENERLKEEYCLAKNRIVRRIFFVVFNVFIVLFCSSQGKSRNIDSPPYCNCNCKYVPKYSAKDRARFYPFRIADTIKLVSYRYQSYSNPIWLDTVVIRKDGTFEHKSFQRQNVLIDSLIEVKTLDDKGVASLTNVLYNHFYEQEPEIVIAEITQCFLPRNAILFYNKEGKLFESILICFHCDREALSSNTIDLGQYCFDKIEKLKSFFIAQGIKFGTNVDIPEYPGETLKDRAAIIPPSK